MVQADVLTTDEAERGKRETISATRHALPALAAHFADLALKKAPTEARHKLTLKKSVQRGLEASAREAASKLGPKVSVAMVLADSRNGNILGEVGSANYFDGRRQGWIDMTRAVRSPGSTLKPFIYGLAFEQGMIAQETIIEDRPQDFAGYRPRNFDMSYQGDVSIRQALQMSLNVPTVSLLDAIGPARLTTRFIPGLPMAGVAPPCATEPKRLSRRNPPAPFSPNRRHGRSEIFWLASCRRKVHRAAASPTRPAHPMDIATRGLSAMTDVTFSASGSGVPMAAPCRALPVMHLPHRYCSMHSSSRAWSQYLCHARQLEHSEQHVPTCR
jgi:hypothetical protein